MCLKEGPQDIGRSRGGQTAKIHAVVDGLENLIRLLLTGGEAAGITQAQALIDGFDALSIVADKGYDSNAFIISITSRNGEAAIPSRKKRIIGREYDHHVYKHRNLVERFFIRIMQFRRLEARYVNSRDDSWQGCILSLPSSGCNNSMIVGRP